MIDVLGSLHRNQGYAIFTGALMTILTTIAVALKLLSRWLNKNKLGMDDWLIMIAQLLWYPQYALQLYAILVGRKATSLLDPNFATFSKYIYTYGVFYFPIATLANLSVLFFYRRIFSVNQTFRKLSTIVMALQILWFIPGIIVESAPCSPPSIQWTNPVEIPEKCIFYGTFFVIIMSVELGLDVLILSLPINEIIKLKLSWQKKTLLSLIFLLGGFVIVTGIVRIVTTYRPKEQLIDFTLDVLWLNVHLGTSIICACLPTYRPLITKGFSSISSGIRKYYSSFRRTSPSTQITGESGASPNLRGYKNYAQFSGDEVNLVGINRVVAGRVERERFGSHDRASQVDTV